MGIKTLGALIYCIGSLEKSWNEFIAITDCVSISACSVTCKHGMAL